MPFEWQQDTGDGVRRMLIWRYRSLTPRGFVWVIGLAAVAFVLPLIAVVGRAVLWGLLPFVLAALGALWWGIQFGWRSGGTREELALSRDMMTVTRHDPGRKSRFWQANPYWVRLSLRGDGPVEDYLVASDGQRRVELGAFLSPEERRALRDELDDALTQLRVAQSLPH